MAAIIASEKRYPIILARLPITMAKVGTSVLTKEFAPTTAPFPMITPPE
jgi:hypothetical protein